LLQGQPYNCAWYVLAFASLTVAGYLWILQQGQRWLAPLEWTLGSLSIGLVLLLVVAARIPGGSFLVIWPILSMLLALAIGFAWPPRRPLAQAALLLAGAAVGVVLLAPQLGTMVTALGAHFLWAMVLVLALSLGWMAALLALIARPLRRLALVAGIGLLVGGALTSGFDAVHPRPFNLSYVKDGDSGRSYWISSDAELDSWTARFFPGVRARKPLPEIFGAHSESVWAAQAPDLGIAPPALTVISDRRDGNRRSVELEIRSLRHAPDHFVEIEGTPVLQSSLNGHLLTSATQTDWSVSIAGFADEPARLAFVVAAHQPFRLRVLENGYGLPALVPTPPPDRMVQPFRASGMTRAARTVAFGDTPSP
jgi:hypothetical protein